MDPEKRTTVNKGLHQPSIPSASESEKRLTAKTVTATQNGAIESSHAKFCRMIGMPAGYDREPYPSSMWNLFGEERNQSTGLYARVRAAYRWHTFQYWLVAVASNTLLIMTICFGATLTALGSVKSDRVSIPIIVLSAIQTVFGGFITYFKSRNQPNRARQFRISLKRVLEAINNAEGMFRDEDYVPPPYTPILTNVGNNLSSDDSGTGALAGVEVQGVQGMVLRLMDMYMDAVREAEANYPDYWLSSQPVANDEQRRIMSDLLVELKKSGATVEPKMGSEATTTPATAVKSNQSTPMMNDGRIVKNNATDAGGHTTPEVNGAPVSASASAAAAAVPSPAATAIDPTITTPHGRNISSLTPSPATTNGHLNGV